jgi:hypothetical protein
MDEIRYAPFRDRFTRLERVHNPQLGILSSLLGPGFPGGALRFSPKHRRLRRCDSGPSNRVRFQSMEAGEASEEGVLGVSDTVHVGDRLPTRQGKDDRDVCMTGYYSWAALCTASSAFPFSPSGQTRCRSPSPRRPSQIDTNTLNYNGESSAAKARSGPGAGVDAASHSRDSMWGRQVSAIRNPRPTTGTRSAETSRRSLPNCDRRRGPRQVARRQHCGSGRTRQVSAFPTDPLCVSPRGRKQVASTAAPPGRLQLGRRERYGVWEHHCPAYIPHHGVSLVGPS